MIREPSAVHRLSVCLVCLLVLVPGLVTALELGPIETRSALYEPLDARIPVHGAQSGDLRGLNVALGSPAQFELAGVARLEHLNLLQFVVVEQEAGDGYIHVRTDEPIIEPSLTFLIDVDWPRGRTVRGYRLHLSAAVDREAGANQTGGAAPQAQSTLDTDSAGAATASSEMEYGPVRKSETLWSIAARTRPGKSISVQRMMLAMLQANPNAFEFSNVNALNAGAILRIPAPDEIGPDNLNAAIAEVQRQHSEWTRYRNEGRAAPSPSAPTSETPTHDSETGSGGRLEVVSSESTMTPSQDDDAQDSTLRKELALATEEADAGRRESDELKLRLVEAEDHIKELNRLVELKNEEIAALRSELHQIAQTTPQAAAGPAEAEPKPAAATEEGAKPVLAQEEAEPHPTAAPEMEEEKPELISGEMEPKATTAAAEPKSLPFGLGSLPVNPVYLVGGAGLLLILLGVVALLRRRRTPAEADEFVLDDALEADESSPPGEDNLLLELEAVAAELSDEQDDSRARSSRAVPAETSGAGVNPELERRDRADAVPVEIAEERIEELWRDDRAVDYDLGEEIRADDDSSELTFDIDALTADDSDSMLGEDDGDESSMGDLAELADLADLAAAEETGPDLSADEASGNLDLLLSHHETRTADSDTPVTDVGGRTAFDYKLLDEEPDGAFRAAEDDQELRDWKVDGAGMPAEDVDVESEATTDRFVDDLSTVDGDAKGPERASQELLEGSTEDGESEAFSLDEFGEDEVQTKIDLAQVYMEMGDTESARGFLEAVLAEGNAEQQEAAREMLSKLG